MVKPGSNRSNARNPRHRHRSIRISVRAVTEFPVGVVAPAFDSGVSKQRTRMHVPGSNRSNARNPRHRHRSARISVRTITKLPVEVVAPAFDRGISLQRTRMLVPGRELC